MRLEDEEFDEKEKERTKKTKKIIVAFIVILFLLIITIFVAIAYRMQNPTQITTYIDGVNVSGLDEIIDIQKDAYGKTKIYLPIRDFASYLNKANPKLNYQTYKGDYNPKTEEDNKCYVMRDKYEVAIFTEGTKKIYKLNLQDENSDYEECNIDTDVFRSNGKLYTSLDGIEQSYNITFNYDEAKKIVTIYTLDYLISSYQEMLKNTPVEEYGIMEISDSRYANWKSAFDNLLIVKASNNKYGIMNIENGFTLLLEPQYDEINFLSDSSTFLVKSNGKVGLFTEDGRRKIDLIYDDITLISKSSNLYVVKVNNQYGVVDENGNTVIYPEYARIGMDISSYAHNNVKNGYILLDTLIPVMQNEKWGFFNTNGEMVTNGFLYENIGCNRVKSGSNIYGLLQIPEQNVIVVGDENGNYTFMDLSGNDKILPYIFTQMYIKMTSGQASYWMTYNNQDFDVLTYLNQVK